MMLFIAMTFFSFGQKKDSLFKLSVDEFNEFPKSFDITNRVFQHYYDDLAKGKKDNLNPTQKTLCYYFICEGMIDNSGFYSILLESLGEYNVEYGMALERIGANESLLIWNELVQIFELHESYFLESENPPELDDESDSFDNDLANRIEALENSWYDLSPKREQLFEIYLSDHKSEIVSK